MKFEDEALYVARKSAWVKINLFSILLCVLIIPLFVLLWKISVARHTRVEFYDGYAIEKSGIFSRHEKKTPFTKVVAVSVDQTFRGRIFHYGDVNIDVIGKWDIDMTGIANPEDLKEFLEEKMITADELSRFSTIQQV